MEDADEVVSTVADAGVAGFGRGHLARWHRAGLIPQPTIQRRGKGHGTRSLYPPGTSALVLDICAHRASGQTLEQLGFVSWVRGASVPVPAVRPFIRRTVAEFDRLVGQAAADLNDDTGRLEGELEKAASVQLRGSVGRVLRPVRKRVGAAAFPEVLNTALVVATGRFTGFRVDPADPSSGEGALMMKALGMQGGTLPDGGQVRAETQEGLEQALFSISNLLSSVGSLAALVDGLNDEDLIKYRDEFLNISVLLSLVLDVARHVLHRRSGFNGIIDVANVFDAASPVHQAWALVFWVMFRVRDVPGAADFAETAAAAVATIRERNGVQPG